MALADYNYRYFLPFKDEDGNQWRVRIFDRDNAGSVERLIGTGFPVQIEYEADDDRKKGVIGSSCTISVYGIPSESGNSDLSQFFTGDEERFYVKIEYLDPEDSQYKVYWTGFLYQDEYREHITSEPYMVELVAMDRLGSSDILASDIGYHTDSEPTLISLVQSWIDETKQEFVIDAETPLIETENGVGNGFLYEQRISAQTFFTDRDEYVEMKPIKDIIEDIMISLYCRAYQEFGKLVIRQMTGSSSDAVRLGRPTLGLNETAKSMDNNLYARHMPASRSTSFSYAVSARNLFFNGSFERDNIGDTSPIGWFKPSSNTLASISVSDEASASGSKKSIKTINNEISDSSFDGLPLSNKLTTHTLLQSTTRALIPEVSISFYRVIGKLNFSTLINNTSTNSEYEIRISIEKQGDGTFYNFEQGTFGAAFNYGKLVLESTGEWEDFDFDILLPQYTSVTPPVNDYYDLIFRVHTMDYDQNQVQDVEVFYDNFSFQVYNLPEQSYNGLTLDTNFYNTITNEEISSKTKSTQIDLSFGISGVDTSINNILETNEAFLLKQGINGQYWNDITGKSERVVDEVTPTTTYTELPTKIINLRRSYDAGSKRTFEGNIKVQPSGTSTLGVPFYWKPLGFGGSLIIDYDNYPLVSGLFKRFRYDLKANRVDIETS